MSQVATKLPYKVLDCSPAEFKRLAEWGRKEIELAENEMPGLMALREKHGQTKPLAGRPHRRLPAHDDPDGRADRDARASSAPKSPGAAATFSRTQDHAACAIAKAGFPVYAWKGMNERGVRLVHRADAVLPRRRAAQPDPRRRRRPHRHGPRQVPRAARRHPRPLRRNDHRRPSPLPDARARRAEGARDQRQRLGHQEQVRQPLRLPRIAGRRHQAGHRHHDRRQGRRRRRLRRRRQGLCPIACAASVPA